MKKIKIACLGNDLSGGGAERVQIELMKLLDRDRFSLELAYLRDFGDLHKLLPQDLPPRFFADGDVRFSRIVWQAFRQYRNLAKDADLLFGMMDGLPIYLASAVGWIQGKPSVGWIHNTVSKLFAESNSLHRILAPRLYPKTTQLVCVSDGSNEDIKSYCSSGIKPITIYNPIDIEQIQARGNEPIPKADQPWFRKPVIVGVGRLVSQKRFDRLLRAFQRVVAQGIDANLVLVGQGALEAELRDLAQELEIMERVLFAGFQQNPYPYIKAASTLVLSSEYEGFGNVLVEAMCLGVPVVSVDCPSGPREILEGGRNGILVPFSDPLSLPSAIVSMIRDITLRREYI